MKYFSLVCIGVSLDVIPKNILDVEVSSFKVGKPKLFFWKGVQKHNST
jgi:hypothetical protein